MVQHRDEKLIDRTLNHFLFKARQDAQGEWVDGQRWGNCGRVRTSASPEARVTARITPEGVGQISGYQMCGSIWACPQCGAKIRQTRAEQISKAIRRWLAKGGKCYFVTPTIWHHKGMRLSESFDAVLSAWRAAFQGRSKSKLLDMGYGGFVRAFDLTLGEDHRWHPHIHAVIFIHSQQTYDQGLAERQAERDAKYQHEYNQWLHQAADVVALGTEPVEAPVRPNSLVRRVMTDIEQMERGARRENRGILDRMERLVAAEWTSRYRTRGLNGRADQGRSRDWCLPRVKLASK